MKKYFLSFIFIAYIFLFGLFTLSADILPTYAKDCYLHWNSWVTGPPGTLQCKSSVSAVIQECLSDGTWKDYYDCSKDSDSCENFGSPTSARCSLQLEGPTPTPKPTIPVPKCPGDYSPNEEKCENNNVMVCEFQKDGAGNIISTAVQWNLKTDGVCSPGTCQPDATNKKATCIAAAGQSSPTPTPTTAMVTDPSVKCTHSERTDDAGNPIQYDGGSILCTGSRYGGYDVEKCVKTAEGKGEFIHVGLCESATLLQGFGINSMCSYGSPVTTGDVCNGTYTADDPECISETKAAQQMIPQPGVNCGIPASDLTDPTGADLSKTACCYSQAADLQLMPLHCFIGIPGGKDMLLKLTDKINSIYNCLPSFSDCSQEALNTNVMNVGKIRKILKDIPPCMPRTTPATLLNGLSSTTENGKDNNGNPVCTCVYKVTDTSALCDTIMTTDDHGKIIPDAKEQTACKQCMLNAAGEQGDGIWTAIGCVNISTENGFIQSLFQIGISLGGAFALLCNVYGAFLFQTSRGNPEGLKKAQDMITSCITGLLLIIFSVFILRLIGYNILRIPGFG